MQLGLDFGAASELSGMRDRLRSAFGPYELAPARSPIGQLVKSIISSRTRDEVSTAAYQQLIAAYPVWSEMRLAAPSALEAIIAAVEFADVKAGRLVATLHQVQAERGDFDLRFLRRGSVTQGLAWLETLPGVGRKVAASTLNFSILAMPAFVIDSHVLRVLRRLELVRPKASTEKAYNTVMPMLSGWTAAELRDLHVLMKVLGQTACRPQTCAGVACPLSSCCPGAPRTRALP